MRAGLRPARRTGGLAGDCVALAPQTPQVDVLIRVSSRRTH